MFLDQKQLDSPLGQPRNVSTSGIGNVVGLQNLQTEYKDLNQIRADKSILQLRNS